MADDVLYPIWRIDAKWEQDGKHDPEYPKWSEGLPEGRIFGSTGYDRMYRETVTQEQVETDAREWWEEYVTKPRHDGIKIADRDPQNLVLDVKFERREAWCLEWFCHSTFDVGQSDEEALASFERFVQRMEDLNQQAVRQGGDPWLPAYVLMGAEDRWRWSGERHDDRDDEPPPCRCNGCKKLGLIRINH